MAIIKEPKGVDFIIKSPPLTEKEKQEINEYISKRKVKKQATKRVSTTKSS